MYFEDLDLNDNVLDALYDMHFDECTPIQEKCIPEILNGHDVLGVAQTGTGKTAAYLLPILSKLADGGFPEDSINCLIMSPTRELAQQIDEAMQGFSYYLQGVSSVAVYGGNDGNRYEQELKSLSLGADVVIATPGRFISHISLGNVDLSKVSFFILDEADRMLDMGFSDDILSIAKKLPSSCQTIMFSATMPKKIEELAKTLLKNPVEVKLAVSKPAEKIHQMAYVCYEEQKLDIIRDIFKAGQLKRVIIFSGSKQKVKQSTLSLQRKHINCDQMHSDLEQSQRDEVMFKFKSGQIDVLVATDIVSRGIDIDDITMVINYDVPRDVEDYVHRIGRTARADRDGEAITLVNQDDIYYFQQIEKFLEKEIEKMPLPEGCGEGPEYKSAGKPKRGSSAKNRRKRDRDQQSHKDKKRRNKAATRRPQQKQEQQEQKEKQAGTPESIKPAGTNSAQKPKDTKRSNRPIKPRQATQNEERKNTSKKEKTPQKKSERGNNPKGKGRKQRPKTLTSPMKEEQRTTKYAIRDEIKTPKKSENSIKRFFKKIFGK